MVYSSGAGRGGGVASGHGLGSTTEESGRVGGKLGYSAQ